MTNRKSILKRIAAVACASALVVTAAGCSKKQTSTNGEVLEINWLGVPRFGAGEEDGYAQKVLEEKYNIKIKPYFIASGDYANKKTVLFLSGEVPDLVYENDPSDVKNDADQGFIIPVDYDEIKQKAPDVYKEITAKSPGSWLHSYHNGENYGVPNLYYPNGLPNVGIWRKDWLENVGIEKVPETIDELHEALYRFRHNDPDGNGKKDTYGMSGDVSSNWNSSFNEIFGAFGAMPFWWIETDNGIEYGGLQDNVKETLAVLSQWYKEGIIHPDFISDTTWDSINSKFLNGEIGYQNQFGGYRADDKTKSASPAENISKILPEAELVNALPLTGPKGHSGRYAWGINANIVAFGKDCTDEKKDVLFKIMNDSFTDEELALKLHVGEQGTMWRYIDEKLGKSGGIETIPEFVKEREKHGLTSSLSNYAFFAPSNISRSLYDEYTNPNSKEFNKTYRKESDSLTDYFYKVDIVPSASKYLQTLRNQQLVVITQIIRGEKSVDHYDTFIEYWHSQGGDVLTKEANACLKDLQSIYDEIGVK